MRPKWLTLRVAKIRPLALAVAAIRKSKSAAANPCLRQAACKVLDAVATNESTAKIGSLSFSSRS